MSTDSTVSPEKRQRIQQLFAEGKKQMEKGAYEYADNIYFTACVLHDPCNTVYAQTFLANLRKKFGEKKKTTRSLIAAGKQMVADVQKKENLFKTSIDSLKSNPWDVETLISAGKACEALGSLVTAVIYYQAAVDADPTHVGANIACCAALRETADFDGALACVQRIIKQRPQDRDIKKLLSDISADRTIHKGKYAKGENRDTVESVLPEGEEALGIVEQIERRIANNPQDSANYAELAQWYYNESDFAKAEEYYGQAVGISSNAHELVERLLETQKQRLYVEVVRLKDEYDKDPREELKPNFFSAKSQFEAKCIELAQHRIKYHPNHTGYRYDYGILLQKSGQFKEAIAEFQIAKAELPRRGDCLLALGQCFQLIKQNKLAMTHYQEAVAALEPGENKKKALYLAMKLACTLEDFGLAESYGHQLAAIDYAYRDLAEILEQIAQRQGVS